MPRLTIAALALSGLLCELPRWRATAAPLPGAPADHFLRYRARAVSPTRPAARPRVILADRFETASADLVRPTGLGTPAGTNGAGVSDPATHLKAYRILSHLKHVRQHDILVENEFGDLTVDTVRPESLLVPTSVNSVAVPPPPGPNQVDAYKCYRIRIAAAQPPFQSVAGVRVTDEFETRLFDLTKPRHLCVPVGIDGGSVKNSTGHLLCYDARLSPTPPQAPHVPVRGLYANNQFGPERLDILEENELCVPSLSNPASLTTTTTTMGTTTTSLPPSPLAVRGCFGKDPTATGFDHIVQAGFRVVDRGAFRDVLDALPAGVKGWVWLGNYDNQTCTWQKSDDWIRSHVAAIAGDPKIAAYYIVDEPHVWDCPSAPADVRARAALVKSLDPGPPTLAVIEPHLGTNPFTPYVGAVDVIGVERFPCSYPNGCVMTKIDETIQFAEQARIPRYWALIQAFADTYYRMPTADELREEFQHWRASRMEGYLVFSWAYGNDTLENHPDLVDVLKSENAR